MSKIVLDWCMMIMMLAVVSMFTTMALLLAGLLMTLTLFMHSVTFGKLQSDVEKCTKKVVPLSSFLVPYTFSNPIQTKHYAAAFAG